MIRYKCLWSVYESIMKILKHDKWLESTWHAWPYLEHDIEICETKWRLVDSFCLLQQRIRGSALDKTVCKNNLGRLTRLYLNPNKKDNIII